MPNIHHLELFYYVARHGGISGAVRRMPYGIRQPTISAQILRLEDDLGRSLFQRHPFQLTSEGQELYDYLRPFFEGLDQITDKLRGAGPPLLRLASSPMVLRDYLPQLLEPVRRRFPGLRLLLREGQQSQVEKWFASGEIDLAVTTLEGNPPPGCRMQRLLKLPLILLTLADSPVKTARQLWKPQPPDLRLIGPPLDDAITRAFRQGLARVSRDCVPSIEVNSIELIETYVRHGYGVGISVQVPGKRLPPGVRALPLPGFPAVNLGAFWRGAPQPVMRSLLQELAKEARTLSRNTA